VTEKGERQRQQRQKATTNGKNSNNRNGRTTGLPRKYFVFSRNDEKWKNGKGNDEKQRGIKKGHRKPRCPFFVLLPTIFYFSFHFITYS
jgi:hypothetical protein